MTSKFTHLHVHSHYSLLEALPKVDELVRHAKKQGAEVLALTDNGNMFGAIEFVQECRKAEIKPIIGYDAYVAVETIDLKRHRIDDKSSRLVLLAENMDGYKNLMKLATVGFLEGFYYRPRIDRNLLREHRQGLIALAGPRSDIGKALVNGEEDKARERLREYLEIFGPENFFLELQHQPDNPRQRETNDAFVRLARELGASLLASRNVYYLAPDQAEARKLLLSIRDGRTLEDRDRTSDADVDLSMTSPEEIAEAFKDLPEALENNAAVAGRCDVKLELGKWNFPVYPLPEGKTAHEHLRDKAFEGLCGILNRELASEETDRLNYELDIVEKKGYAAYFLVVADYTSWARSRGIISVARGSAAASLMAYAVGITTINPLYFKLPFERFLNPLRPSAPDIDMDFADDRRDEVLEYVKEKYGRDRVAQICTFGTMAARGSVRDTGRALGYPLGFVDQVAKMIPFGAQGFPMTIDRALKETPELKARYDHEPDVRRLLDLARQIEGNARHCSVHAAGVVISDKPLIEYAPLQRESGGENVITQYEMNAVEAAGVLKMDFLGLRNLSILGTAIDLVKRTKGAAIDLYHMTLDDKKTYEALAQGKTMGLFQLNGEGMTKWLMQLKPTSIFDIMAMVALYRPGPIEIIPDFIRRKHNPGTVTYMDPRMKEYLQDSYGLFVYQEDLLLTSINIAGYDWGEADKFRKAVGKKIPEEMAKQEEKFKKGVIAHGGLTPAKADAMWKLIEPFAAYGFNKGHAASYAVVAYQTAYLKANYPAEYMTALMTAESGDLETVAKAVAECKHMGIEVLPPDINESRADFTYIDDAHIRFGLKAIKNLGEDTIATVIAERKAGGPFKSLEDFAGRVGGKAFNKKSLEALAKSGAMETLSERNRILDNLDLLLAYNKNLLKEKSSGQSNLFAVPAGDSVHRPALSLRSAPPAALSDILSWEKELLGLYVTAHPFAELAKEFEGLLTPIAKALEAGERTSVRIGGTVTTIKKIFTKKSNEAMLFVGLEDGSGAVEVLVFPSVFKDNGSVWNEGANLIVTGKMSRKDDEPKILADRGWPLTEETIPMYKAHFKGEAVSSDEIVRMGQKSKVKSQMHAGEVCLELPSKLPKETIALLKETLAKYPGRTAVVLRVRDGDGFQRVETGFTFDPQPDAVQAIERYIGFGNVKVIQPALR